MTAVEQIALHIESEVLSTLDWEMRQSSKSRLRLAVKQKLRELKHNAQPGHPSLSYLLRYDLPQSQEMLLEMTWEAVCQNQKAPLKDTLYAVLNKPELSDKIAKEYATVFDDSPQPTKGHSPATQGNSPDSPQPTQDLARSPNVAHQALVEKLWQEGYRLGRDLQWYSKAEAYSGLAVLLRHDFSQAAKLHPEYAPLLEAQIDEIEALAKQQRLSLEEINPQPSEPWMPLEVVEAYLKQLGGYNDYKVSKVDGNYVVEGRYERNKRLERMLGKKPLASEVAEFENFQKGFYDFLINSPYQTMVEDAYNSLGNHYLQEQWPTDPIHTHLKGWNPQITPHPWQNEAAHRYLMQGNLINALDVGLGKTLSSILTVFKAKQDGWAKRVVIATPGGVIAKWYQEIMRAKPDAKVWVIGARLDDGWKEVSGVQELSAQLATAIHDPSIDIILMTHTTLGRIPMDPINQSALIKSEFQSTNGRRMPSPIYEDHVLMRVQQMIKDGELSLERMHYTLSHSQEILDDIKDKKKKAEKKAEIDFLSKASTLLNKAAMAIPKLAHTWESLSVDLLVVDEAHNFKALWELESRHSVRYMGRTVSSQRACDLLYKVRSVQQANHGKGVLLLSATPMVNGPTELYNMISLVAPQVFESIGIHDVSDFVDTYCVFGSEEYLDDNDELKTMRVLQGLTHVGELRRLALGVIQKRDATSVGLKQPESTPEYLIFRANPEQQKAIEYIAQNPVEALNTYMGLSICDEDLQRYRLVIAHLLKRAELDMEMLDPHTYQGYISPKVQGWLEETIACIKRGEKVVTFVDTTEMPSPQGVNPHGYSFHQKLKNLLVEYSPLQPSQIAIVNAKTTPTPLSRYQVSKELASGKVLVVIGNTATMGEGMDLQIDVANLLRLEIPWNRAKFDQQSGRVKRQGNLHERINEKIFMGSRGLDVTMMDVLRGKSSWYKDFWEGKEDSVSTVSEEIIPSLDMIRCLAIADESEREAALQKAADQQQEQIAKQRLQKGLGLLERYQKVYRSYLAALAKGRNKAAQQIQESANRVRRQIETIAEMQPLGHLLDNPLSFAVLVELQTVVQSGQHLLLKLKHHQIVGKVTKAEVGRIVTSEGEIQTKDVVEVRELSKADLIEMALEHDPAGIFAILQEDPAMLSALKQHPCNHPPVVWSGTAALYSTPAQHLDRENWVWPDQLGAVEALQQLLQKEDNPELCQQIRRQGFKVKVEREYIRYAPYVRLHYQVASPLVNQGPKRLVEGQPS